MSRRLFSALLFLLSAAVGAVGCEPTDEGTTQDGGNINVGPGPGAGTDAGGTLPPSDAGQPNTPAPTPDAGDSSTPNTPKPDAATSDAATPDAGRPDAAGLDATAPDSSTSDSGEAGLPDASTMPDADASPGEGGSPSASCLDGIKDYQKEGPFKYQTKTSGKIKFWVPQVPAGCKVPVVHLANGTTAVCDNYLGALQRLASHGFLTACYEDPDTGAGDFGVQAFEAALSMFPDLADNKLGSTGHSQGGQASIVTTQLAEAKWGDKMIYATLAMQPASGYGDQPRGQTWKQSYAKVKSPVFMFSGNSGTGFLNSSLIPGFIPGEGDGLVGISWVQEGFDALSDSIEAYHWLADGATHIPTPVPQEQQVSIPWFRWKLLGDNAACTVFKNMTKDGKWKMQKEQNAKGCE